MPALVALVERAALQARLARTPQPCSAVLAGLAVTPGSLVVARRAPAVQMEHCSRAPAAWVAWAEPAARAAMLELAALVAKAQAAVDVALAKRRDIDLRGSAKQR